MNLQQILDDIAADVVPHLGIGKVADYIPALAQVDPHKFGDRGYHRRGREFPGR